LKASPAEARREIQAAAKDAIAGSKKPAPDRHAAHKVRMQLRNFTIPEVATAFSEIQLVAPDTVEFTRASMLEAYRVIRASTASSIPTDVVTGTDPFTCRFDAVSASAGHDRSAKFAPRAIL
jgi:D-aminopeptidase